LFKAELRKKTKKTLKHFRHKLIQTMEKAYFPANTITPLTISGLDINLLGRAPSRGKNAKKCRKTPTLQNSQSISFNHWIVAGTTYITNYLGLGSAMQATQGFASEISL